MKICLTPAAVALARAGSEFFALADVGGEGDDLAAVGVLQPFEDDGGIQTARIGEDDFLGVDHGRLGVSRVNRFWRRSA